MSNEKYKTLEDINDCLIVQKITERNPAEEATDLPEAKECFCFETECKCEINLFIEEQKAIIRKERQLLQADERGKQALNAEIAALRRIQDKKAELIRNRQYAREIENDRAKKIASLPPPLPKSVKELLKKSDNEPKATKPDVQMPEELSAVRVNLSESRYEDKENIIDPEELEARQKVEAERQMKAKKRFNEALKKDRLKEEYSNVMKQIQVAELQNRREMAKNFSSDKQSIPCPLSDKFQTSKKQADMEETAEKLFKRTSKKEHIIEDIEGYEDVYEEKYKKIHSNYESEMIDCIPSFVKENYGYLLKDESNFEGAKNFEGLDDSGTDILNQAYIETPPGDDVDGRKNIDLAFSRLDKLRADNETEYEQTIKPLLAAAMEVPKKELIDKAVETDSTKLPAEDKAVETDLIYDLKSPSPTQSSDFNAKFMAFKRRPREPMLRFYPRLPDMQRREVYYPGPSACNSDGPTPGTWSSSSYCSLPSKHGVHTLQSPIETKECDICVAEKKDCLVNDVPHEHSPEKAGFGKPIDSSSKPLLSKYVRQLAEKYLAATTSSSHYSEEQGIAKVMSVSPHSGLKNVGPAFEKETICKSRPGLFVERQDVKEAPQSPESEELVEKSEGEDEDSVVIPYSDRINMEHDGFCQSDQEEDNFKDNIYSEINYESSKSPTEYSDYDLEAQRVEAIKQVLTRRKPPCATPVSSRSLPQIISVSENEPRIFVLARELSTIQELDSALTGGSLHLSESKLSDITDLKSAENSPENSETSLAPSPDGMKIVSLLDPPDSEIAELAKSIHFTCKTQNESPQHSDVSQQVSSKNSNAASALWKETISMPSNLTNSSSSSASSGKVFSSTLTGNDVKRTYIKHRKFLPQFHVSDIDSKKSSSEFISNYSSSVSSSSQSLPSVVDKQSNKKKDSSSIKISQPGEDKKDSFSVVSGYIRDIETPNESHSGRNMELIISCKEPLFNHGVVTGEFSESDGSLKPMTLHSNISTPSNLKTPNSGRNMGIITSCKEPPFNYGVVTGESSESDGSLKPMTLHSNISTPSNLKTPNSGTNMGIITSCKELPFNYGVVTGDFSESDGSLKPMTLHSNISTPSNLKTPNESNSGRNMGIIISCKEPPFNHGVVTAESSESDGSLKPMALHSNISTPSNLKTPNESNSGRNMGIIISCKEPPFNHGVVTAESSESDGSLKPMTLHSNISTPSYLKTPSEKNSGRYADLIISYKDSSLNRHQVTTESSESDGSLKPMTLHSNISTPSYLKTPSEKNSGRHADLIVSYKDSSLNRDQVTAESSESDGSLKPMTLHSNISTPSSDLMVCMPKYEHQKNSSGSSDSRDLNPQEVTITPSFPYSGTELKRQIISSGSSEFQAMTLRLDIATSSLSSSSSDGQSSNKRNVSQLNYHLALKTQLSKSNNIALPDVLKQTKIKTLDDGNTEAHNQNNFGKYGGKETQLQDTKALQKAHQCSSDFFVPHISKLPDSNIEKEECGLSEGTMSSDPNVGARVSKSIFSLRKTAISIDASQNQQNLPEKRVRTESLSSNEEILASFLKRNPAFGTMKGAVRNLDAKYSEERKGFRKQYSNLQAISSTCSSTENLSEISESKVVFQSTPIKNISEIIKEPGILEEPDLTLHATLLDCKADPSVKRKGPLTPLLEEHSTIKECSPSLSECKTPENQSPQYLGSANTPSMMSFLQHELSCLQSENTVQSMKESDIAATESRDTREVKRPQFPRRDYKERTKRLWKNLEAVKKREADQERRKETMRNRLRAKQYAQKITPKRK